MSRVREKKLRNLHLSKELKNTYGLTISRKIVRAVQVAITANQKFWDKDMMCAGTERLHSQNVKNKGPSFPFSESFPSGSIHKPLYFSIKWQTDWKLQSQKLTNLTFWTTALSNSMKLWAMMCRATQDRWVMMEISDKTWSTGEGNGKPLQYSCLQNPMKIWKGKKIGHWKMNSPDW